MTKLLNKKKLRTTVHYASARNTLRVALTVTASLATLVAIPGWLRSMEATHHPIFEHVAADTEIEASQDNPQAAVQPVKEGMGRQHQALADSLGKRYRVSKDALERFIHDALHIQVKG